MIKIALFTLLLLSPLLSFADGYWMELNGSGKINQPVRISIYYGGVDDSSKRYIKQNPEELKKLEGFKLIVISPKGERTELSTTQNKDHREAYFTPSAEGTYQILGLHETLPVVDRSETPGPNIRPIQYLCAQYNVGKNSGTPTPKQFVDIIASKNTNAVSVQAFVNQKPAAEGSKIRIFNPENWEKLPLTDSLGKTTFYPTMKGLYIIRLDWIDKKPGSFKESPYQSVRHRCDYSLYIN